ncbi:MAG TPA: FxLYD domain-containing protein [Methylomirabilota bacterium]|jgi:hypothetical protein
MSARAHLRRSRAHGSRFTVAAVVALLWAGAVGSAGAQENFRVTYGREQPASGPTIISGTVFNDARLDAFDVYVTAQALNDSGKVVASGITYVTSSIPAGRSSAFTAKVPNVPGVASFRVSVSSARMGYGAQSP